MKSSAKKLMSENLFKVSNKKDGTRFFSQLMVHGYDFAKRFWPQRVLKKIKALEKHLDKRYTK